MLDDGVPLRSKKKQKAFSLGLLLRLQLPDLNVDRDGNNRILP